MNELFLLVSVWPLCQVHRSCGVASVTALGAHCRARDLWCSAGSLGVCCAQSIPTMDPLCASGTIAVSGRMLRYLQCCDGEGSVHQMRRTCRIDRCRLAPSCVGTSTFAITITFVIPLLPLACGLGDSNSRFMVDKVMALISVFLPLESPSNQACHIPEATHCRLHCGAKQNESCSFRLHVQRSEASLQDAETRLQELPPELSAPSTHLNTTCCSHVVTDVRFGKCVKPC